jgi:dTDP-glucose 4,6-dehydratase
MTHILVTGGAGFIGSNFVEHLLKEYPHYTIINLDSLTYAADKENMDMFIDNPRHILIKDSICNKSTIDSIFKNYTIQGVIHFAAESHVDNSISGPDVFIQTNIVGTFNLLDAARKTWMSGPGQVKETYKNARFLHISTDEVYGSLGKTGLFLESTPYAPNSPYSASKASSDFIVRSYKQTYDMNTIITNCSNNYGPQQHDEKLIPTIIRSALSGKKIPIYGDGKNIRDWLYVTDHCKGISLAFHKGKSGETYNIGGKNERENIKIALLICSLLDELSPKKKGSYKDLITYVEDRAGHDRRYAIDATKIEENLGWKADETFETGLRKTVQWYIKKYSEEKS